ncbi:hypothetical protein KDA_31400 [Dictyobacter alpinus]|uniref:Uncharacterized protein n=1 Tax=Dictyobacter alpinus TaxID=2014873 RepID=A0A402B8K1_9CHLR|nr:hypothetical protein KDA_31400 [Dictyobacter alpinus]
MDRDDYLLEKADEGRIRKEQRKRILCIWDGSVLEKAKSSKGSARLSQVKRRGDSEPGEGSFPTFRPYNTE